MDEDTEAAAWAQLECEAQEFLANDPGYSKRVESIGAGAPCEQEFENADYCD